VEAVSAVCAETFEPGFGDGVCVSVFEGSAADQDEFSNETGVSGGEEVREPGAPGVTDEHVRFGAVGLEDFGELVELAFDGVGGEERF